MKLIIDIPEIFYQNENENKGYVSDLKRNIVWDAMIKGTPLDDLRAEIEQYNRRPNHYPVDMISISTVLEIIDKYRNEVNHEADN